MGWILAIQNLYVEAQGLNDTVFRDRTFTEIRLNDIIWLGP